MVCFPSRSLLLQQVWEISLVLVLFCDVELVCVDTLIRAHSLILWFVSLLGACLYGSAGEQMGLLSQFCEIYFACGDVSIEARVCWLGCFTRRRCNIHL